MPGHGSSPTCCAATSAFARHRSTLHSSCCSSGRRAQARARSSIRSPVGRRVPTGVLRPTTRVAVVLVHPDDREALVEGAFAAVPPDQLRFVEDATVEPGLAVVDAPDIDSLEHANRVLADRLVEAADLCCFVTTATRYADRVPWAVLSRVEERGLPLLVVVNRMPPDPADRSQILDDIRRLVAEAGLNDLLAATSDGPPRGLIAVREGALAKDGMSLQTHTIEPLDDEIARLRADVRRSPRARRAGPDRIAPRPRRQPRPHRRRRRARGHRRRGAAPHRGAGVRAGTGSAPGRDQPRPLPA